jgi:ABC-type uncharacterized transport system permease subunit
LSGITTFCFAASYTVALLLELTRLWFRSGIRGVVLLVFAGAGMIAHTLFLGYSAHQSSLAHEVPLSSAQAYYYCGAWLVAALYLYALLSMPKVASGLFLLPLVLLLIAAGTMASEVPFTQDDAALTWGRVHGIFFLLGYVAVGIGFVVGLMYLIQANRLKKKVPAPQRLRLPALESLERANHRATIWAAIFVSLGFLSSVILNLVRVGEIPWSDPVIWRSVAILIWLLAAATFSAWYMPAQRGRKVAYLTIGSFAFLVASVAAGFLFSTAHKTEKAAQILPGDGPLGFVQITPSSLVVHRSSIHLEVQS